MAVYEKSLFGTEKYGPNAYLRGWPKFVDYAVDPVVAEPSGYHLMSLRWKSPTGDWTGLRILKNFSGYSVSELDGEILLDTVSPTQSLLDGGVHPGAWHYYTIFVKSLGLWQRAGGAAALMTRDHGYGQRLFDHLPTHHQIVGMDSTDTPVENETLKKFLGVLGWGMDSIKTNFDSLQSLNDPSRNHLADLARLASQLGITYEATAPAHLFRKRVRNAAVLGRVKGTLDQLESLITMTTSYDTEVAMGPNLMVTDDAASFAHPIYPWYDAAANYEDAERVRFNNHVYQCKPGGAYGLAQAPSGDASTNTWWTSLIGTPDASLVDADGAISGWEATSYTDGVSPGVNAVSLALGVQSFRDSADWTGNALKVTNTNVGTSDLGAHSVARRLGETTMDREQILRFGAPIPVPRTYSAVATYPAGSLVVTAGHMYRSLRDLTPGVTPGGSLSDDSDWEVMSLDDRVNVGLSLYAKGGAGFERPAYPVVEFWDEQGALVATVDTEAESLSTTLYDSFRRPDDVFFADSRTLDAGAPMWTVQSGPWVISENNGGVAWPTSTGLITLPGMANGNVSTSFDMAPAGVYKQFVVFRAASATSFLKATRLALYSSADGIDTLIGTYSTPFDDKDRITVNFVGSVIIIKRNGDPVLTTTSAVNQTATLHGLGVA